MAADYINNPIESYHEMQTTIYGDRLATGKYAKGSSEPLGATATSKLAKKAKKDAGEEEDLISTLWRVGSELAAAIVTAGQKSAPQPPPETVDEIPDNLYETLLGMEGYSEAQIACYFAFLVENPKVAKAFMKMGHIGQLIWMARYISKEFKD